MDTIIEPETDRIQLRQWKTRDYADFAAMSNDPKVMEFFPKTLNREESDAIVEKCKSLISQNGWGVWAAELKATKEFIGIIGLHVPTAKLPSSPCVEILWRLATPYWGRGYATEAAWAALEVGFETLELEEIVSFAVVDNVASRGVMERIQMTDTGVVFNHPDVPADSHLVNHCLYKMTQEKWLQHTERAKRKG